MQISIMMMMMMMMMMAMIIIIDLALKTTDVLTQLYPESLQDNEGSEQGGKTQVAPKRQQICQCFLLQTGHVWSGNKGGIFTPSKLIFSGLSMLFCSLRLKSEEKKKKDGT